MAIPHGYEVQVRSRSGTAVRNGITCLTGTIDSDYRGELMVVLVNLGEERFDIHRGDRIAQLIPAPVLRAHFAEVADLDETGARRGRLRLDRTVSLSDAQLDRYARHIVLREIGGEGQRKLLQARIVIVGAGGIGSPAIQYLAAAGIGAIRLIDDDRVALDNLQRQILFGTEDVGRSKVIVAGEAVARLNPDTAVEGVEARLTKDNAADLLSGADLVLDGSDNFATRLDRLRPCDRGAHPARSPPRSASSRRRSARSAAGRRTSPATAASSATRSTPRIATAAPSWVCWVRWRASPAASPRSRRSARSPASAPTPPASSISSTASRPPCGRSGSSRIRPAGAAAS